MSRSVLTLREDNSLTTEEKWLKGAYSNIVAKLIHIALSVVERFDPIATTYYGIHAIEDEKEKYQSLLEVTSYYLKCL